MAGLLAVVGHTARDLVDAAPPRPGGVPLYAAKALSALGERAVVVTRCAEIDRNLLRPLRRLGLPIVWRAEAETATFVIRNRPEGRELEIGALGEPWMPADVDSWVGDALATAAWVHAGPLWRGDFPAETLAALARGRRLSFDAQGLVRRGELGPVRMDGEFDDALLAHVDVLHLSEREAAVAGLELEERSLGSLAVPEVVVTLGDRGSLVLADGRLSHVGTRPVPVADPTGAGDAFVAAYCASRLRGHRPVSAARRASELLQGLLSGRLAGW